MTARALKVLVVDDSAVVRQTLTAILEQERGITVVVAAVKTIASRLWSNVRPTRESLSANSAPPIMVSAAPAASCFWYLRFQMPESS